MNKKKLRKLLLDPMISNLMLPAICFVLGGIIVPLLLHRWDNPSKMFTVNRPFGEANAMDLLRTIDKEFSQKIEIFVEGQECKDLKIATYRLHNTGDTPILPEDFVVPFSISVQPPWKIIAITRGLESLGEKRLQNWERKDDQHWIMKPTLFNPGDSTVAVVYATSVDENEVEAPSSKDNIIDYDAHIIGVNSLEQTPDNAVELPRLLNTTIQLQGWAVYAFVAIWMILLPLLLIMGVRSGLLPRFRTKSLMLLLLGAGLSMGASEIIVSLYLGPEEQGGEQWLGSWVILVLYLVMIGYFSYLTAQTRRPTRAIPKSTSNSSV